jgi:16S rRNA (cytosine1402-N4)-methyltransferase
MSYQHIPVLLSEVIEYLNPKSGEYFIDATFGGGGYTFALAEKIGPEGKILAIDADNLAIHHAKKEIKKNKNIIIARANFRDLFKIVQNYFGAAAQGKFSGIVFDLGLSQAQLKDRTRGFSFRLDAPLDMRIGDEGEDLKKVVNQWPADRLAEIIQKYGEEKYARRIAAAIVVARKKQKIETAKQLAKIIMVAVPRVYQYGRIHPATRTFQALRILANNELRNLVAVLPQAVNILRSGGRLAVVSYHSLEDRIVKNFFRTESRDCLCKPEVPICQCGHQATLKIITRRPVRPSEVEIKANSSARSAKLRVAERK